ncbi:ABC transporter permease [Sphingosinicella microcystinivorans]|uniref:ABC transporter permease n=1 Tax=Sphingosinicella microcystinivorans TaxID=335406 RepID=UPI0022F3C5A0|nr:FtsX-like permease family protein [Sphingosinicella microcystinivorans]WBX84180.1 FtsX-like permease family protein [Sphingosinicella microcystinivorans]
MIALRSPLHTKLLRDLWRLRAQSAAIALVIAAGVGMVVMSFGMIRSLEATRAAYYDQYRFADVFAPVRRAPDTVMREVAALPGVAVAESRISTGAVLDIAGIAEPVSARVHSLPPDGRPALNRLVIRSGRLPDSHVVGEVVASEAFAAATRLQPGDRFNALLYGKRVELRLVGTALSPEHVYAVAPGQIFPDNRRYGILWMGREPLAASLDMVEAFNEAAVRLAPGARGEEVIRRLDTLLAPYGGTGAYGREQQISDRFLSEEINQLGTTVEILPPIFLGVAAFLLNIVLGRLVDTEREVIGLLKAFGYRNRTIMLHYAQLALLLSAGGLLLGILLGLWLGRAAAGLYQQYFAFPFLEFRTGPDVFLIAATATLAAVLLGALGAVRRAARLTPAEAMRPPAPADFSGGTAGIARALGPDEPSRMILRGLLRRPLRSGLTVAGIASALALYIAAASTTDGLDRMIDLAFGQAERGDVTVTFAEVRDARALHELQRMPGVLRVEPFRAAGARLIAGPREEREGLSGAEPGGDLSRLVDIDGRVVEPAARGALISGRLARLLDVRAGDTITAAVTEGERPRLEIPVAAVVDSPLGGSALIDRAHLNRLLREGDSLSGAYLSVDAAQLPALYAALKQTPLVAGVTVRAATLRGISDTLAESMGIMTLFTIGFSGLIVLGVVYNSARISLSERARDLASMRVLGFRRPEVAFVLLGELALLVLAALPPGMLMGVALSRYMMAQFSADLYTIPYSINAATLAEGALVVGAAAALTALLIRGRVDRLDLVRALKTRE